MSDHPEPSSEMLRPEFSELSLWEVMRLFIYHPQPTFKRLLEEISLPTDGEAPRERPSYPEAPAQIWDIPEPAPLISSLPLFFPLRILVSLLFATFLALLGANRLWSGAVTDPFAFQRGDTKGAFFWFGLAWFVYIGTIIAASLPWWQELLNREARLDLEPESKAEKATMPPLQSFFAGVERHSVRMALIPIGLIFAYLAYSMNVVIDASGQIREVIFTPSGVIAWFFAIFIWALVLGVDLNLHLLRFYQGYKPAWRLPRLTRPQRYHVALLLIMLLAVFFRFYRLSDVPPAMTSDHIEKLLDGLRVYEGYHGIFFRNNGGREGFQMYWIAFLAGLGFDFSFNLLKIASGLEGLLTVGLGFWFGRVVMGKDERDMGIWLGLSFAALLAVSSWHTMISRLGLRIALTPLTTLLLFIFLVRAMRHNRRADFVWMGVILGAGTYFYQSNRMLPLLVVLGVGVAAAVYARSWREFGLYGLNLMATGMMAIIIFLPMYRYQQSFPDDFWNRTRGRLFGEGAFVRTDPESGLNFEYEPTWTEQLDRFTSQFDLFTENYVDALEMWGWQGDGAWINNGKSRPAFDPLTNGLFMLGIIAWGTLIFKKWDMGHFVVPLGVLIMLLPSALTLAYQVENPSFTRASGTIPFVFLLAAYPLAQLGYYAQHSFKSRWGIILGLGLIAPLILLAARINYNNYFNTYRESYSIAWKPYDDISGPLREFAQGEGSYGNAFLIAYPHWLDHRILGTMAGDISWNNGLVRREDVFSKIQQNQGTDYEYDPSRPTFFMYNILDIETKDWLETLFPEGSSQVQQVENRPELAFMVFIAPPDIDWESLP